MRSQQPGFQEERATNVDFSSVWARRLLTDSIYLWACGEKAHDEDEDIILSDRLIGWLVLLVQGFSYATIIVLARAPTQYDTSSSADELEEPSYLLPSVVGAMYLLVATTSHDLRAGFSLLVDGKSAGHRAFGICLLIVYGIMIAAAMTVLVSTSADSASVVLNAVTVLFIADLDEKALRFLWLVPQNGRLFWAIESFGISFALALVAIVYTGNGSPLLKANTDILKTFPTWFIWGLNPVAVTLSSILLSSTLRAVCELISESSEGVDGATCGSMITKAFQIFFTALKEFHGRVRLDPYFYVIRGLWLAHGVTNWRSLRANDGFPVVLDLIPTTSASQQYELGITAHKTVLLGLNVVLVTGLVTKALSTIRTRNERVTAIRTHPVTFSWNPPGRTRDRGDEFRSRAPALLVGWGTGYWVTSLLYVLGNSLYGGGWPNAPLVLTVTGYFVIPCVLITLILVAADSDVLESRVGAFVKPTIDILKNRRRVEFWIMATVLRDFLVYWIAFCTSLKSLVNFW